MKGTARILNLPDSMKDTHDLIDGKVVRKADVSKEQAFVSRKKGWQHSTFLHLLVVLIGVGWSGVAIVTTFKNGHQQDLQRTAEFKQMERCVVIEGTSLWRGSGCDKFENDPMYEVLYQQRK
jgi:hypothetical protein